VDINISESHLEFRQVKTRAAVLKVRGLAAVRRCDTEEGGYCCSGGSNVVVA
jgi:hypothetical protein